MRVCRISKRNYANTAFSGEGTQKVGGRWTPVGGTRSTGIACPFRLQERYFLYKGQY